MFHRIVITLLAFAYILENSLNRHSDLSGSNVYRIIWNRTSLNIPDMIHKLFTEPDVTNLWQGFKVCWCYLSYKTRFKTRYCYKAPQIRRVSRRHCALYKFTYLLTYLKWANTWYKISRKYTEQRHLQQLNKKYLIESIRLYMMSAYIVEFYWSHRGWPVLSN